MDLRDTLLLALQRDPADLTAWLALADCLEERDDLSGAELLRLHHAVRTTCEGHARQSQLRRIRELLLAGVSPCWPTLVNSIGTSLALVPAGTFWMGAPPGEVGHQPSETPCHEVAISRSFYLGIHPVTQAEFRAVLGRDPSEFSSTGAMAASVRDLDTSRFPVEHVTWEAAVRFCEQLSARPEEAAAGHLYRLPTEAEWEYACRAWLGSDPFHLGHSLGHTQANFRGSDPYGNAPRGPDVHRPTPVGSYPPNPFGLFDMHGNVWEWCSDWFDPDWYARSPRLDPTGPPSGVFRVQRGGCWGAIGSCCRSAYRTSDDPDVAQYTFGFRVAMTAVA